MLTVRSSSSRVASFSTRQVVASRPVACRSRATAVRCRAEQIKSPVEVVHANINAILNRYDFLSSGVGALCVTSYCVMRGQEPFTALSITAVATITALVINELVYNKQ